MTGGNYEEGTKQDMHLLVLPRSLGKRDAEITWILVSVVFNKFWASQEDEFHKIAHYMQTFIIYKYLYKKCNCYTTTELMCV